MGRLITNINYEINIVRSVNKYGHKSGCGELM